MWLCDCERCLLALRAEAAVRPQTTLVVKTMRDRFPVTAEQLLTAMESSDGVAKLLRWTGDRVREIFVATTSEPDAIGRDGRSAEPLPGSAG
jgi:hypothetical protein